MTCETQKILFRPLEIRYRILSGFSSTRSDRETAVLSHNRENFHPGISFHCGQQWCILCCAEFFGWRIFGRGS